MNHTLSVLVENKPGVLTRVASLFARRGFNIDSLAVGVTEDPTLSRMTIVVDTDEWNVERLISYLYKLVNVIQVHNLTDVPSVHRDLALIKINAEDENRGRILQIVEVFRARIVDVSVGSLMIEITGDEDKIEGFVEVLRPWGIVEMVRTGLVSMARGGNALMVEAIPVGSFSQVSV